MDYDYVHAIWTALSLAAFVGIVLWAWSGRQRQRFAEAARLPLDDGSPSPPPLSREGRGEIL